MINLNKELIKHNIFTLLYYSGLTDISFAYLLEVSDRQIKRIRKNEAELSINNINKACDFFKETITTLNSKSVTPDRLFREKLIEKHHKNTEYSKLLIDRPSITYAITFELLENKNFKNKLLTVSEINKIFISKGWQYSSSYISLSMTRHSDKISKKPHPTKSRVNLYTIR